MISCADRRLLAFLVAVMGAAATFVPAMAAPIVMYSTSFSAGEGYTINSPIAGQNGWATYEPSPGGGGSATVAQDPANAAFQSLRLVTGTDSIYAYPANYGAAFTTAANAGYTRLVSLVDMYLPSGQTASTSAFLGSVVYNDTYGKILTGFLVNADTGAVFLEGYYDNNGTLETGFFDTGETLGFDQWVTVGLVWDQVTGLFGVQLNNQLSYALGAAAGETAFETDIYTLLLDPGTPPATAYFDNLTVTAVPEPATGWLAAVAAGTLGWVGWRRRRAGTADGTRA